MSGVGQSVGNPKMDAARVRELAEFVRVRFSSESNAPVGFDRMSVERLEQTIERERAGYNSPGAIPEDLIAQYGAFLGECVLASADGHWVWDEFQHDWGLALSMGGRISPAGKVWRQFMHGRDGGESIIAFYDIVVDYLAKGKLPGVAS